MRLLATAQTHDEAHSIAVSDKALGFADHRLHVVIVGFRTQTQFFQVNASRFRSGGLFGLLIAEFAEIHDSTNRRFGCRGNFDQIQAVIGCDIARLIGRHHAQFIAIGPDDEDLRNADLMIDSVLIIASITRDLPTLLLHVDSKILLKKRTNTAP